MKTKDIYKNLTFAESEYLCIKLKKYYITEINKAANRAGGTVLLSKNLGYDEKYLYKLLKRDSFSALRRVVNKIHENE